MATGEAVQILNVNKPLWQCQIYLNGLEEYHTILAISCDHLIHFPRAVKLYYPDGALHRIRTEITVERLGRLNALYTSIRMAHCLICQAKDALIIAQLRIRHKDCENCVRPMQKDCRLFAGKCWRELGVTKLCSECKDGFSASPKVARVCGYCSHVYDIWDCVEVK